MLPLVNCLSTSDRKREFKLGDLAWSCDCVLMVEISFSQSRCKLTHRLQLRSKKGIVALSLAKYRLEEKRNKTKMDKCERGR